MRARGVLSSGGMAGRPGRVPPGVGVLRQSGMTGARQPPTPDHPARDDDEVPAPGNSGQRPTGESSRRLVAGRYRLDTLIGHGSTGTVWAATDQLLRRRVAVKKINLPRGMPAEAARLRERTLREARAAAALSSPHVVTVFDILPATPTVRSS